MSDRLNHRTSVSLPPLLHQRVEQSLKWGAANTFNQLVCAALENYLEHKFLERWDETLYSEFESGFLHRDPATKVLFSRSFQRDLNQLSREIAGLRRIIYLVFRRLKGQEAWLNCLEYFVKRELEPPHYFLVRMKLRRQPQFSP